MKFYRVAHHAEGGQSGGFEWATSKREAAHLIAKYHRDVDDRGVDSKIDAVIEIEPTKDGIKRALNRWASHPDNG